MRFTINRPGTYSSSSVRRRANGPPDRLLILLHLTDPAQAPATVGTGIGTGAEFHFHPGDVIRDQTALGFVLLLDGRQLHPRGHGRRRNLAGLKCQLKLLGRLGRGPEPVRPVPGARQADGAASPLSLIASQSTAGQRIRIACALTSARSRAVKLRSSSGSSGKVRV